MRKGTPDVPPPQDDSLANQLAIFVLVLSQFVGSSAVGVGAGWLLWKKMGFPWWILLFTSALGLGAASLQVIRFQKNLNRKREKQ
jgi:F0F1-type ATP synthase assembly protein I